MITSAIQTVVSTMDANGDSFTFGHSASDWQNLDSDEKVFPAVFLDFPVRGTPDILPSGAIRETYSCVALFLYKTHLADTPEEVQTEIAKAHNARQEFILKCLADPDTFKDFTPGQWYEVEHIFDRDVSGVIQPFTTELRSTANCDT